MSSVLIQNAVHSHLGGQTSVRASVLNSSAAIAKGTVRIEFYKFFPVPMNPGVGKETGQGFGPVPSWVKSKYPAYLAPEEATEYQQAIDAFKTSTLYTQAQAAGSAQALQTLLGTMPEGFIMPRKVAEQFANSPVPGGESVFYFAHVFPGAADPWDFIRISLLDQLGAEIAAALWYPS